MSIRKTYRCCLDEGKDLSFLAKHYPITPTGEETDRQGAVRRAARNANFSYTDLNDGLVDSHHSDHDQQSQNDLAPYSLNKRCRWRLITTLPQMITELNQLTHDDGNATDASSETHPLPVSFVLRKVHSTINYRHWGKSWTTRGHAHAQAYADNVAAVSSTLFPLGARTVRASQTRRNKTSTLTGLMEKTVSSTSPTCLTGTAVRTGKTRHVHTKARQSLRGISRLDIRGTKYQERENYVSPNQTARSSTLPSTPVWDSGVVYEIAVMHDPTSHYYRKDRHKGDHLHRRHGGKSRNKSWDVRHACPLSDGYKYEQEINDSRGLSAFVCKFPEFAAECEGEIDAIEGEDDITSVGGRVWNMDQLLSATAPRLRRNCESQVRSRRGRMPISALTEDNTFDLCYDADSVVWEVIDGSKLEDVC